MRELVAYLARALVTDPEAVEVSEYEEAGDLVIELRVAKDDLGRVIGREGKVANALRTIARAAGTDDGRRVTVEIAED
jgi:predicted RNA-binding protein YlqC (UPF0109 family)